MIIIQRGGGSCEVLLYYSLVWFGLVIHGALRSYIVLHYCKFNATCQSQFFFYSGFLEYSPWIVLCGNIFTMKENLEREGASK